MRPEHRSRVTKALKYLGRYVAPLVPIGLLILAAIGDARKGSARSGAKLDAVMSEISAVKSDISALKAESRSKDRRLEMLEIKVFLIDGDLAGTQAEMPAMRRDLAGIRKSDSVASAKLFPAPKP